MPEISSDGLTYTFTLKSGINYGDPFGDVEVTSGDIVRALERESDPNASVGGYNFYYNIIDGFAEFGEGWKIVERHLRHLWNEATTVSR